MADPFDIDATLSALIGAVEKQAKDGWSKISGLVTTKSKLMVQQAAWIAESSADGPLKDDPVLRHLFADQLADSVKGLARDVAALTILTIEQVWNAAVKVLWDAINKVLSSATGGLLTLPTL